ncbi:MAG: ABC transporter permease, partial [Verrucomicrobiales bacterium]|nr:ABC transporter permease [Verrucomicrobiales bacterium]
MSRNLTALWESMLMALDSIATHKLRSCLTLLGILIGVFSIIVVMTALRAVEKNAETSLTQLGPHTFTINRTPPFVFEDPGSGKRPWEREPVTARLGTQLMERLELPRAVGLEEGFRSGQVRSRHHETNPDVGLKGATSGAFAAGS